MRPELVVLPDPAAVAAEAARRVTEIVAAGPTTIALAGGSTPKAAYALLAQQPGIDWARVTLLFGDERCVPPDHADSNFRMVKESLLDPLAARGQHPRVERIEGELDPDEAARRYAARLPSAPIDLVLLGMGPDGHTASLFPGAPELAERARAVVATVAPHKGVRRISLTYPTINAARRVLVLATGADKSAALALALSGPPGAVPLRDVRPDKGTLTILVDRAISAG